MARLPSEDDLQAWIDGRLSPEVRAALDAHLAEQPELARRLARDRVLRDALRAQLQGKLEEPVPERLRIANIHPTAPRRWGALARGLAAAVVLIALGGTGGWWLRGPTSPGAATAQLVTTDAVAAYRTFVVEVAHPVEVRASEEAHLVGWLSKRLDRPLMPPDLSSFGYALVGGRLLPAGPDVAAQLMYEDATGARLTVYVRSGSTGETAFRFQAEGDVATFAWLDQDTGFAVSAAMDRASLLPVAEAIYHALG